MFTPHLGKKKAEGQGIGRLALKSLAKRNWRDQEVKGWTRCWYSPVNSREEEDLALRFTLSLSLNAAVSPGHIELFRWACDIADSFTP